MKILPDYPGPSEPRQSRQQHVPAARAETLKEANEEGPGVLLYYKYIGLGEYRRAIVKEWYLEHCGVEGLRGRYRFWWGCVSGAGDISN